MAETQLSKASALPAGVPKGWRQAIEGNLGSGCEVGRAGPAPQDPRLRHPDCDLSLNRACCRELFRHWLEGEF